MFLDVGDSLGMAPIEVRLDLVDEHGSRPAVKKGVWAYQSRSTGSLTFLCAPRGFPPQAAGGAIYGQIPEHGGGERDRILTRANEVLVYDYCNSFVTVLLVAIGFIGIRLWSIYGQASEFTEFMPHCA